MKKYDVIDEARTILGLPETATMDQIRDHYRDLMRQWHPDTCSESSEKCHKEAQKITDAYRVLLDYCQNYRYSFTRDDVNRHLSEEEWYLERFGGSSGSF